MSELISTVVMVATILVNYHDLCHGHCLIAITAMAIAANKPVLGFY